LIPPAEVEPSAEAEETTTATRVTARARATANDKRGGAMERGSTRVWNVRGRTKEQRGQSELFIAAAGFVGAFQALRGPSAQLRSGTTEAVGVCYLALEGSTELGLRTLLQR